MATGEYDLSEHFNVSDNAAPIYVSLTTGSTSAEEWAALVNSVSANPPPPISFASGSFTFTPTGSPIPPVVLPGKPGFWLVGGREISTVVLLALVEEFFAKQDRIANPPKFKSPEEAQAWLDEVS